MAKGKFTALQQLTPISTDFGKLVRDNEALQFKYREEARLKKAADDAIIKEITEDFGDYDTITDVFTGINTLDDGIANGVFLASEMKHNMFKEVKNSPKLRNNVEFQRRDKNLDNFSKDIEFMSKTMTDRVVEIAEREDLSGWFDDTTDSLNKIYRDKELIWMPNKKTGKATAFIKDKNGKLVSQTRGDIEDGKLFEPLFDTYDLTSVAREIGKDLGGQIQVDVDGFEITSTQYFKYRKDDVSESIKGLLGSPGDPSPVAKSIWADRMRRDKKVLTQTDLDEIEKVYMAEVKLNYDEFKKMDPHFAALEAQRKRLAKAK